MPALDIKNRATETLRRYWGYDTFRPVQEEIIMSVLGGRDTLGLLPTGGGKSLTFQVPAMMLDGLTLVITPLISLMKDQVDNLRERGIKAYYLQASTTRREHNLVMDRCAMGLTKLLYVSPEKLSSASFASELSTLPVKLIAVDEAHCISQWGYDFRPSYLKIAEIRRLFPATPVLALTASATPAVRDDIISKLHMKDAATMSLSFKRDNISFVVRKADYKEQMLLKVLKSTHGSAIVYVRSRRRCRELSDLLQSEGISSGYYHAGLTPEDKEQRQNMWKRDEIRVIVATNAFGMGIDKADVRIVIHMDLPSSLEEYYQEAGRAGRDGEPSYAVIIANSYDKGLMKRRINESFPDKEYIRKVYELAGNFLEVALGSGYDHVYEFNFPLFCQRFKLRPPEARAALMLLSRAGYIDFNEDNATRARVMVTMQRQELYGLELDEVTERVFQTILRTYTGLFADYAFISESRIASIAGVTEAEVYESLLKLGREHALHYIPRRTNPTIYYTTSRELPRYVQLPTEVYEHRREAMEKRVGAMMEFTFDDSRCRVAAMLKYFGENDAADCGKCDVCRSRQHPAAVSKSHCDAAEAVRYLAGQPGGHTLEHILAQLMPSQHEAAIEAAREMIDSGAARLTPDGRICIV